MQRKNRCKLSQACIEVCPNGAIGWRAGPIINWEKCDQCGNCAEACLAGGLELVGRYVTADQVMAEVLRDVPFYDQSGGGVTFTGGEPMLQVELLRETLLLCKAHHIHTAVDTSGHTSWENFQSIYPLVDLFLYDVKLIENHQHIKYTSVSNKLILDNLHKLAEAGAHIIVRLPLIPGINDDEENIELCAAAMTTLPTLEGIEVMPYHTIGTAKYKALGLEYKLENVQPPSDEQVEKVEQKLSSHGLAVIKHQGRAL